MAIICPDCQGAGKIEKPLSHSEIGFAKCETCEGKGFLSGEFESELLKKLDKIIELLDAI